MQHRKIRLDCKDRNADEVVERLARELEPSPEGSRLVLVVENLRHLRDSLTALLKNLLRFFNDRRIRASIVDPSGCASTLIEALGGNLHVEACRHEKEVSEPQEILLVEDTEDSLEFIRTLLEEAGHRVTVARTGQEALQACRHRSFDLILLDLVLPDLDGLAVARSLGKPRPRIVVLSAYLDRWSEEDYAAAGLRHRIRKPFRLVELLRAVREP